jgi:hypothetical protein
LTTTYGLLRSVRVIVSIKVDGNTLRKPMVREAARGAVGENTVSHLYTGSSGPQSIHSHGDISVVIRLGVIIVCFAVFVMDCGCRG